LGESVRLDTRINLSRIEFSERSRAFMIEGDHRLHLPQCASVSFEVTDMVTVAEQQHR
jgi:hypothetical protein